MAARHRWTARARWSILGLIAAILLAIGGGALWLDSPAGHRFIASQIARREPASGLRVQIGRIEGSIYSQARLFDIRLSDPRGTFLVIDEARLDWFPFAWLSNRLDIDRLHVTRARMFRKTALKPGAPDAPILPGFDIRLLDLRIDQLALAEPVAGQAFVVKAAGKADIRGGRAILMLDLRAIGSADQVRLALDSRPDDNHFDINGVAEGPAGGLIARLAGTTQPVAVALSGQGDWQAWRGSLRGTLGDQLTADLALTQAEGQWTVRGPLSGSIIASGIIGQLSGGRVDLAADGTMDQRIITGTLTLGARGRSVRLKGGVDLGRSAFDILTVDLLAGADQALARDVRARALVARARLDGPFSNFGYEYLASARALNVGKLAIIGLRADGKGRYAQRGVTLIPVNARAERIDGGGDIVTAISRNATIRGDIRLAQGAILPSQLAVSSARGSGTITLARAPTGASSARFAGTLSAVEIAGLGVVDADLLINAGTGPRGAFALDGQVAARMQRLDNAFLRGLGGGAPRLRSAIRLAPDNRLLFDGLVIEAPLLSARAHGYRRTDGTMYFEGNGVHQSYGPFALTLDGRIERPTVTVRLDQPLDALGLRDVALMLRPDDTGFALEAQGQSRLGRFDATGAILLPRGGAATIRVDRLALGGMTAQGALTPVTGGLAGRLDVAGSVAGTIDFTVPGTVQQIDLALAARRAQFAGPPALSIARGTINARLVLNPGGTTIDGKVNAVGVQSGALQIGRLDGSAQLVDGVGKASATISRQRGRLFNLKLDADIAPQRINLMIGGTLGNQPIRLFGPARLVATGDGWSLAPATLRYAGGTARLSGETGSGGTSLRADIVRLPLSLADLANPDLGLGGTLSGQLNYETPRGGVPTGRASLRIDGLTRSGLVTTSRPIDIGVNAMIDPARAAVRAVIAEKGKVIGRAQALIAPLATGDGLIERIGPAPIRGQVRYAGDAGTIWGLTNVELFALSGDTRINADIGGTLSDPSISGLVTMSDGRLQSPVTGMTLTDLDTTGTFSGGQLRMDRLSGQTKGGGRVEGTARFDLSGTRGVGIDMSLRADRAVLLDRDDIGATVSGPITIRSDGNGGTIAGTLDIVSSRFSLGRASTVATIPQLSVIEINRRGDELPEQVRASPWRLDIAANARNRLMVTGLGMDSEWRADLQIGGTVTNPALTGRADLVRGSYDFAGKRFDLNKGMLRFTGTTPINPVIDIDAVADVSDINATIRVRGSSAAPEISFSSVPALPEDELLSRLLFGTSITNLSAPEAIQLAAAVAAFQGGGGGLDPINAVRRATGLSRLRILPADASNGQQTSIAAGKYIGRRIYVELITDGQGYSATRIEYQITRWLSILSSVSTIGRQSINARVSRDY